MWKKKKLRLFWNNVGKSETLLKRSSETVTNEVSKHKVGLSEMLLGTLGASLPGNLAVANLEKRSNITLWESYKKLLMLC